MMKGLSRPNNWWRLLGPLILMVIIVKIDLTSVIDVMTRFSWSIIMVVSLLMLPILILRACRWFLLLPMPRPQFMRAGRAYALASALGSLTPAQVGELSKVAWTRAQGITWGRSLFSVIGDRLFDLTTLIAVSGIWTFIQQTFASLRPWIVVGIVLVSLIIWQLSRVSAIKSWFNKRYRNHGSKWLESLRAARKELVLRDLVAGSCLTLFCWLLNWLAIWMLAQSIDMRLGFFDVCGMMAVVALISMLPITALGLGTREASLLWILTPRGFSPDSVIALSFAILGLRLVYLTYCGIWSTLSLAEIEG